MKDFQNKVVVVTGAGSGIGKETALAFARRGARLAVCDVDGEGLRGAGTQLEAIGREVYSEICDVSKAWQVEEFCANVYKAMGRVDVLVNDAGVGLGGKVEDMSLDDWEWIIGANLWGVIHGVHYFYPRMIAQGGEAHIVNIASGGGLFPMPMSTAYCCTKGAVVLFSETLRGEAALHGIGVTAICPGLVSTNIIRNSRIVSGTRKSSPEELEARAERIWEGRKYHPSRVADAVVRAVEKDTGVAVVGPETRFADMQYRLSRRLYDSGFKLFVKLTDRSG
jgi:NAD(P)-dependent dehydrogenase (short-subunit alcohol dehydrogenase family)